MMIQPNINTQSYGALKNAKFAAPAAAQEVAVQSAPSESADINFDAPAPNRIQSLIAATTADAAAL